MYMSHNMYLPYTLFAQGNVSVAELTMDFKSTGM